MTAPDPRLDEIQATFQRALSTFAWPETPEERDAAESELTADVRYLLAELRKAHEALERVEALHSSDGHKNLIGPYCEHCISPIDGGPELWPCATVKATTAAVAAAKGDGEDA